MNTLLHIVALFLPMLLCISLYVNYDEIYDLIQDWIIILYITITINTIIILNSMLNLPQFNL